MPYYHVLLTLQSAPDHRRAVFLDLSEQELKEKFVAPYRKGKSFLAGNEIIDSGQIKTVTICSTNRLSAEELKTIQTKSWAEVDEFNRSQNSVTLISVGRGYDAEDLFEAGETVTSDHISGPPGEGLWKLAATVMNHPWVSAITTGLVVAALAAFFGWN